MKKPRQAPLKRRPLAGFTLVEISVVVTLLGLLVAMALPAYRHVTIRSKSAAVANDIRVFATAFQTYSTQHGSWPAGGTSPGQIPPEIADAMSSNFAKPTPIGGHYQWVSNSTYRAAISIESTSDSPMSDDTELVQMVDQTYDDGNLNTGNVVLGPTNDLVFIIEP